MFAEIYRTYGQDRKNYDNVIRNNRVERNDQCKTGMQTVYA